MNFAIFLPVQNGGVYLKICVDSILNQTFRDFRLFILENSSTDDTLTWLQGIDDLRVAIFPSKEPLSIEDNWARIAAIETNQEYMTIIGHDDVLDSNYLETMHDLIEKYPDAGLYQAHFRLIDEKGNKIRSCMQMPDIEKPESFLQARLMFRRDSFGTGYMCRISDYQKLGGIPRYKKLMFADDALWLMLIKDSYKATSPVECFSYREHASSTSGSPDWQSTYTSLNSYLDFLQDLAEQKKEIFDVLGKKLINYMLFWYQWAYFNTNSESEKKEVEKAVRVSAAFISEMLEIFSLINSGKTKIDINKYVFGRYSRISWQLRRIVTWIRRRI